MITQVYNGLDFKGKNKYFIISKSEQQMYNELQDFIKQHGTDENEIYIYINPVKPNKINLRPEYSMEINIKDKCKSTIMAFQRRVW